MFWFTCKLGTHGLVSLKNAFVLTIDDSLSSKYLLVETNMLFLQILVVPWKTLCLLLRLEVKTKRGLISFNKAQY